MSITKIAIGDGDAYLLDRRGQVWHLESRREVLSAISQFQSNGNREFRPGDRFVPLKGVPRCRDIACCGFHQLFLGLDGETYSSGSNFYGELGRVTTGSEDGIGPVKELPKCRQVSASRWGSAAISETGDLMVWGYFAGEHWGSGWVPHLADKGVRQIASGNGFVAGLTQDNQVHILGQGVFGQRPKLEGLFKRGAILKLKGVVASKIAAGGQFLAMITPDGSVLRLTCESFHGMEETSVADPLMRFSFPEKADGVAAYDRVLIVRTLAGFCHVSRFGEITDSPEALDLEVSELMANNRDPVWEPQMLEQAVRTFGKALLDL